MLFRSVKVNKEEEIEPEEILRDSEGNRKENKNSKLELPIKKGVFSIILLILGILLLFLLSKTLHLVYAQGGDFKKQAKENYLRNSYIPAPRGIIYSQDKKPLVKNKPIYRVFIENYRFKNKTQKKKTIKYLSSLLEIKQQEIQKQIKKNPYSFLLKEVNKDKFFRLQQKDLDGVKLVKAYSRQYPKPFIFSPLIGYVNQLTKKEMSEKYLPGDKIGKSGLEKEYEKYLRGEKGRIKIVVNATEEVQSEEEEKGPQQGNNLILNINFALQKKIYNTIKDKTENRKKTAAIAIDPSTGEILSLVSIPSDNNNLYSKEHSSKELKNLRKENKIDNINRATTGLYHVGSILKPLVGAAALQENVINKNTTINCKGFLSYNGEKFKDWKVHGITNINKALAESCNVFFYLAGGGGEKKTISGEKIEGLGIKRLKKYLDLFYTEKELGIDLPTEKTGFVPTPSWFRKNKKGEAERSWSKGDIYQASIGQGYLNNTPLHMIMALSATINGGKIYQPQIADKITNENEETIKNIEPKVLNKGFIDDKNLKIIKKGMKECVESGTCIQLKDLPVAAGGKTGTAQTYGDKSPHSWFFGFAPYQNSEIAIIVLVEYGGGADETAEPIAEEILQWYFKQQKKTENSKS